MPETPIKVAMFHGKSIFSESTESLTDEVIDLEEFFNVALAPPRLGLFEDHPEYGLDLEGNPTNRGYQPHLDGFDHNRVDYPEPLPPIENPHRCPIPPHRAIVGGRHSNEVCHCNHQHQIFCVIPSNLTSPVCEVHNRPLVVSDSRFRGQVEEPPGKCNFIF